MPERLKGADCKSVGYAYIGSNPIPSTNIKAFCFQKAFFVLVKNLCTLYILVVHYINNKWRKKMGVLKKGIWYHNMQQQDLNAVLDMEQPLVVQQNRYHLYISLACPFAHRPYLVLQYLGLQDSISVSSVAPVRYNQGWEFTEQYPDVINACQTLYQVYTNAIPIYSGPVGVPTLWDRNQDTIVSTDSARLALEFATEWLPLAKNPVELVPKHSYKDIVTYNQWLHDNINRKVYHLGLFADNQQGYNQASDIFFKALQSVEDRLQKTAYIHGDNISLSDLFLIPTLCRFETVYAVHFKANKYRLQDFPAVYAYFRKCMDIKSIRDTIDVEYSKIHYYKSHRHLNPSGIVPAGPVIDW